MRKVTQRKERLNGLPNVFVYQKKGTWYLNGKAWGTLSARVSCTGEVEFFNERI